MASGSAEASSPMSDHLKCGICEEDYNESNRLPKMFPCQHSVCLKCMEGMIEKCDGEELTCPLCRHSTPIPESGAAGFPNNLTIMSLLSVTPSQHPGTCPQHPGKEVSVFCVTCRQAVCVTCMIKSAEHKSHEMEELADAMEKCIHEAKEVVSKLTAYQARIEKKARAGDPDCWKMLEKLQKCLPDDLQCHAESHPGVVPEMTDSDCRFTTPCESPTPVMEPSLPLKVQTLPSIEWPKPITHEALKPLRSVVLPEFKHIEINRKNTIMMTYAQGLHEVYKVVDDSYCKESALSHDISQKISVVEKVLLTHQDEVVVQEKIKLTTTTKACSLNGKNHLQVSAFHGNWYVITSQLDDQFECKIIQEKHGACIGIVNGSGVLLMVVPLKDHGGIMIVVRARSTEGNKELYVYGQAIMVSSNGGVTIESKRTVYVTPAPMDIRGVAAIWDYFLFCETSDKIYRYTNNAMQGKPVLWKSWQHLSLCDLGLPADCSIENIWAGELEDDTQVLHVLYTSSVHQHVLASYTITEAW